MNESDTAALLATFLGRLADLDRLLKNDAVWGPVADELLADRDRDSQVRFWMALEEELRRRESAIGPCHKGQVYWRLALLHLAGGDLSQAIHYLGLARDEDRRRGDRFSAAIGLLSVLQPLVIRYKGAGWKFDEEIMGFYESLSPAERAAFATDLVRTHDLVAAGGLNVIRPEYFTFVLDEAKRKVVQSSYDEILLILGGSPLPSYYSCIFSTGSILEGMLDDLFEREGQRLWRLFRGDPAVMQHVDKGSRLQRTNYEPGMTLGEKIRALRFLADHARAPVPKPAVLLMLIIAEYRDLIHPRRRLEFAFEANAYVAGFVFTLLSHVAHHWWPNNISTQLGHTGPAGAQPGIA